MVMTILYMIAALAVFFVVVMAIDCNRFKISEYKCSADSIRKDATVVLLSDLHNKSFGKDNQRLLNAIDNIQPDIILIAGDMYNSVKGGDTHVAGDLVSRLSEKYPVYYGNGNHEHKTALYPDVFGNMYEEYKRRIGQAGIRHLVNEKVTLPELNMDIYGIQVGREYFQKVRKITMKDGYVKELLGEVDESRFSVLIAHNPDYFKSYAKWGADLVVSGHVHGGLMKLPGLGGVISPSLRLFPKYDGGEFVEGKSVMILSRGLGTHTLPIRVFNPGELVVIRLTGKLIHDKI